MPLDFPGEFQRRMTANRPDFDIRGLLTARDDVYPVGSDTKVLSTAFELIARPFVMAIARDYGLTVHEPLAQNHYPDFTLLKDTDDQEKIAVDVKTTYRSIRPNGRWTAKFTLGAYKSFMRNEKKNIEFSYSTYQKHYIVGFVYTRNAVVVANSPHIYTLAERGTIPSPTKDIEYFVQEKYRIASDRPGSGNTTNIGSITATSIAEFAAGNGPFTSLGDATFLDYWRNYSDTTYKSLSGYHSWKHGHAVV